LCFADTTSLHFDRFSADIRGLFPADTFFLQQIFTSSQPVSEMTISPKTQNYLKYLYFALTEYYSAHKPQKQYNN